MQFVGNSKLLHPKVFWENKSNYDNKGYIDYNMYANKFV